MQLKFAVIHPGTQHSWQTALAMQDLGRLQFFATSIFYQPRKWPYRLESFLPGALGRRVRAEFRRFSKPELDAADVRTTGIAEWLERLAYRAHLKTAAKFIDNWGNAHFAARMERILESQEEFGVWGYDNSSLDIFRVATRSDRIKVLDRTNGDWRSYNAVMDQIYSQYPEFFPHSNYKVSAERIDRNDEEFELADTILVGSDFAADTIREHVSISTAKRLRVLKYCFDEARFGGQPPPVIRSHSQPLRFLFVGQVGVRKGIHLILKAFARIPPSAAQLTIVGDLQIPRSVFAKYADRVEYRPTVSRLDMPAIMALADVLLFPSYFEGSALSLIEALASGLAVIQSKSAGCGTTHRTGVLLHSLDENAVYEAIMGAVDRRPLVDEWRNHAQDEARKYSYSNYRESVSNIAKNLERFFIS